MKANRLLNTNKIELHKGSIHCLEGEREYLKVTQWIDYDFDDTGCTTNFITKDSYRKLKKWLNDKGIKYTEVIETKEQFELNKSLYNN